MKPIDELLLEEDEEVLGVLGRDWIKSVLAYRSIGRSFVVVTNRRVHQCGMCLTSPHGRAELVHTYRVFRTSDVSGTSLASRADFPSLLGAFLCLGLAVAFWLIFRESAVQNDSQQLLAALVGTPVMAGLLFAIRFALSRRHVFVLHFSGGQEVVLRTAWYRRDELREFQLDLHRAMGRWAP